AGNNLVYSTLMGGTSSAVYGIAIDSSGDASVTGTSDGFYPTADAFQSTLGGCSGGFPCDAFIAKIDTTGTVLIYGSYLGGANSDAGNSIAVDSPGDAYVTGWTSSANFPATQSSYQQTLNSGGSVPEDAFVTKFPLGSPGGLSVAGILPAVGGNAGTVTATVIGTGFHQGVT